MMVSNSIKVNAFVVGLCERFLIGSGHHDAIGEHSDEEGGHDHQHFDHRQRMAAAV